jgi:hypothetical protein
MGDRERFLRGLNLIKKNLNFGRHANTVQVFETTIRMVHSSNIQ